jgi:hypothetical protein
MNGQRSMLLVEDNRHDERLILRALSKVDLAERVIVARDGQEALDYLFCEGEFSSRRLCDLPAVVLLDINLPKINGLDVLERIRCGDQTNLLPVVILTSSDEACDRLKSYEQGVNSFIRKPLDFIELTEAVTRLGMYWLLSNIPPQTESIMKHSLRIMYVEDNKSDFLLIKHHLRKSGLDVNCLRVDCREAFKRNLAEAAWDLILIDFMLPQLDFFESFAHIRSQIPDMPVILISGCIDEERVAELRKVGVSDFVLKDNLTPLASIVKRVLETGGGIEKTADSGQL